MWLKILLADLRVRCVLTPEDLKWEESADPLPPLCHQRGPQPQECDRTGRAETETGNTFVSPLHFRMDVSFCFGVGFCLIKGN